MKNIYLLATDITSKIGFLSDHIDTKLYKNSREIPRLRNNKNWNPQNIYITSDDEIKKDTKPCWCVNTIKSTWDKDIIYYQGVMPQYHYIGFKKIILTTDQDLIKEGVQAINDEFLEWFVKNPNCENVRIKHIIKEYVDDQDAYGYDVDYYKIIIPKEKESFKHEGKVLSKEEIMANRSSAYEFIDFNKQETLEEAAKNYSKSRFETTTAWTSFVDGAKWQAERMYSEEEVFHIIVKAMKDNKINQLSFFDNGVSNPIYTNLNKWFEQFKKK